MFRPVSALILASALALCASACGLKGPLAVEPPAKKSRAPGAAPAPPAAPASTPPEAPAQ